MEAIRDAFDYPGLNAARGRFIWLHKFWRPLQIRGKNRKTKE